MDLLVKDVLFEFQYKTLTLGNVTLKIHIEADYYFYTNQGVVVKLVNVLKQCDKIILVGKPFNKKFNLFEKPIKSS